MESAPIYRRLFSNEVGNCIDDEKSLHKTIYYGVRMFERHKKHKDFDSFQLDIKISEAIINLMTMITARQFVELFPISKDFDGHKYQCKDYFSTIRMVEEHGWDRFIDDPSDFMWGYQNEHVSDFMVNYMCLISDFMRMQGEPGILERFATEKGIRLYSMHTDENGKKYLINDKGRTTPISTKKPSHLKLVTKRR